LTPATNGDKRTPAPYQVGAEVNIHLPGPMSLDEPSFFVFAEVAVCCDCGFTQFILPERELCLLKKVLARRRQTHIGIRRMLLSQGRRQSNHY
jgi:hypothetical protein